ncbi:hypothetical protein pclt_cds_380b [Pandoravirus celtis]|uniref:Uncharacterized protein n=1 Tax=Pandoravirus celtis TaxID=2568002 RepID=A0A4D6EGL6_9VIRU|nr:hypothetical protein pclt_cds_380b [Pandoravirus celtis]
MFFSNDSTCLFVCCWRRCFRHGFFSLLKTFFPIFFLWGSVCLRGFFGRSVRPFSFFFLLVIWGGGLTGLWRASVGRLWAWRECVRARAGRPSLPCRHRLWRAPAVAAHTCVHGRIDANGQSKKATRDTLMQRTTTTRIYSPRGTGLCGLAAAPAPVIVGTAAPALSPCAAAAALRAQSAANAAAANNAAAADTGTVLVAAPVITTTTQTCPCARTAASRGGSCSCSSWA